MKLFNKGEGARGVWTKDATLRMIEPGQTWEGDVAEFPQEFHADLTEEVPEGGDSQTVSPVDKEIFDALQGMSPEAQARFRSVATIDFNAIAGVEDPSVTTQPTAITPQAPSNSDATGVINDPKDLAVAVGEGAPSGANAQPQKADADAPKTDSAKAAEARGAATGEGTKK